MAFSASAEALTTTLTFNNTAPTNSVTSYGLNGSYTENGVTLAATEGTNLYTVDPGFSNVDGRWSNGGADGSDYGNLQIANESGITKPTGGVTGRLQFNTPSSLQSLQAVGLAQGSGQLILTGNFYGGGTIQQIFNTLSNNVWSTFYLSQSWNNLTSVDLTFNYTINGILAIDNVVVTATPVPLESDALPVVGSALFMAGGLWWKRRCSQTKISDFAAK